MANTKQKNAKNLLIIRFGIIFLVIGIALIALNRNDFRAGFMKPYDIYAEDADANDFKLGDAVNTEIYAVMDNFGTLETTHTSNGAVTSRSYSYYYIIPVFDDYETYFIALKSNADDKNVYDDICDDTWEYLYGNTDEFTRYPYEITGSIQKLDDEAYEYMIDWFVETEWLGTTDVDDIKEYVWPMCIEKRSMATIRTISIIGIAGIVLGILFLALYIKGFSIQKSKASAKLSVEASVAPANSGGTGASSYDSDIVINGVRYMRSDFEIVNEKVQTGDIDGAISAVRDRTGFSEEEAREVVNCWGRYYN